MKLTNYNRAIKTKVLPATSTKPSRIKAMDAKRSITISYPDIEGSIAGAHFQAVLAFMAKYGMDWGEEWGYTSTWNQNGFYFFSNEVKE